MACFVCSDNCGGSSCSLSLESVIIGGSGSGGVGGGEGRG